MTWSSNKNLHWLPPLLSLTTLKWLFRTKARIQTTILNVKIAIPPAHGINNNSITQFDNGKLKIHTCTRLQATERNQNSVLANTPQTVSSNFLALPVEVCDVHSISYSSPTFQLIQWLRTGTSYTCRPHSTHSVPPRSWCNSLSRRLSSTSWSWIYLMSVFVPSLNYGPSVNRHRSFIYVFIVKNTGLETGYRFERLSVVHTTSHWYVHLPND